MARKEEIEKAVYTFLSGDKSYSVQYKCKGFTAGAEWADKNPDEKSIAKYLYEKKGYPVALNGNLPSFDEIMEDSEKYLKYKQDKLIERAVSYIVNNMRCDGYTMQTKATFIRNFKKYMEE